MYYALEYFPTFFFVFKVQKKDFFDMHSSLIDLLTFSDTFTDRLSRFRRNAKQYPCAES